MFSSLVPLVTHFIRQTKLDGLIDAAKRQQKRTSSGVSFFFFCRYTRNMKNNVEITYKPKTGQRGLVKIGGVDDG